MSDRGAISQARIDGRAIFASAAYLIGVGLMFLLERIGAPDGLLAVLGPLLALSTVVLIGALVRTSRIAGFYSADRAGSPLYGAAAFAAIAAGLVASGNSGPATPPYSALAVGFALAAIIVGPLARRTGASSLSDVVAARFGNPALRLALGVVYFGIGVLITTAGYETAADVLPGLLGLSRDGAISAIGVIAVLIAAPGGLAGVFWVAAAAAGAIALALFLPLLTHFFAEAGASAPLLNEAAANAAADLMRVSPSFRGLDSAAVALGAAVLPPLTTSAFASRTVEQARRAGLGGAALAAAFVLAFTLDAPLTPHGAAAKSIHSTMLLLAAVVCAAAGAQSAARAVSADLAHGYESVLASQRLARSRGLAILAVAIGAGLCLKRAIAPAEALLFAAALSLAFLLPPLVLAASTRALAPHAVAAVVASLAAIAALAEAKGWRLTPAEAPIFALAGAGAGLTAGWAAIFFGGARPRTLEASRLFVEPPFDPGE